MKHEGWDNIEHMVHTCDELYEFLKKKQHEKEDDELERTDA